MKNRPPPHCHVLALISLFLLASLTACDTGGVVYDSDSEWDGQMDVTVFEGGYRDHGDHDRGHDDRHNYVYHSDGRHSVDQTSARGHASTRHGGGGGGKAATGGGRPAGAGGGGRGAGTGGSQGQGGRGGR